MLGFGLGLFLEIIFGVRVGIGYVGLGEIFGVRVGWMNGVGVGILGYFGIL